MTQNIHSFPMILDIDRNEFDREALRLLGIVEADFHPNVLVGIRSGGYFLAETMAAQSADRPLELVSVTRRRASTRSKSRLKVKHLLGHAPRSLKNALRVLEHKLMMAIAPRSNVEPMVPDAEEDRRFRTVLARKGDDCRILVVDDAVDSGATLQAVLQYVRSVAGPGAVVRSAVITVTHPKPLVEPDYTLYREVLCRFYWSSDFA